MTLSTHICIHCGARLSPSTICRCAEFFYNKAYIDVGLQNPCGEISLGEAQLCTLPANEPYEDKDVILDL